MAFSLDKRLPPSPKYHKILDPCSYQIASGFKWKSNKVPFLSNAPRKTGTGGVLWTHAIYDTDVRTKIIPNVTSLKSKRPRFPYEAFSKEDLERILCQCGIQNECECPVEEVEEEVICQGKIPRCLYVGPPPRSTDLGDSGLSTPSKRDHGFDISKDGKQRRKLDKVTEESPPFYNARVNEFTEFYHGWKWSKRTSKRFTRAIGSSPGPAEYTIEPEPTQEEICYEKNRHYKRKWSKQLRFIEMIQSLDIREGRPGPASYSPELPKSINTECCGPKAERFLTSKYEVSPGPADYTIKSIFDLPEPPEIPCHVKLPAPACFGVKAQRFKPRKEEGPSPASYTISNKTCQFLHCYSAPFGSSTERFKEQELSEEDDQQIDNVNKDYLEKDNDEELVIVKCPKPTWEFKSKTIRIKPLKKKYDEPSPADLPQSHKRKVQRLPEIQYLAPFDSSEGRFEPWNDWMPVFGKMETPGPAYYCLEKYRCIPAVNHGPLVRSERFADCNWMTPAPNEYKVGGGVETILATHNQRLKDNIEKQHKFKWEPPKEPKQLSYEERESKLLNESIMLLDVDVEPQKKSTVIKSSESIVNSSPRQTKPKFLRCFL